MWLLGVVSKGEIGEFYGLKKCLDLLVLLSAKMKSTFEMLLSIELSTYDQELR